MMKFYNAKETGLRIQRLRKQADLTQEELAQQLEVNTDHLSKIERGGSGITIDMAIALATMFQISLDTLLLGRSQQTAPLKKDIYEIINSLESFAEKL